MKQKKPSQRLGGIIERAYKEYFSDFKDKSHSSEWLIFLENIGPYLSIDETAQRFQSHPFTPPG